MKKWTASWTLCCWMHFWRLGLCRFHSLYNSSRRLRNLLLIPPQDQEEVGYRGRPAPDGCKHQSYMVYNGADLVLGAACNFIYDDFRPEPSKVTAARRHAAQAQLAKARLASGVQSGPGLASSAHSGIRAAHTPDPASRAAHTPECERRTIRTRPRERRTLRNAIGKCELRTLRTRLRAGFNK